MENQQQIVPLHIHQALVDVASELAKVGISKDRRNEQQQYRFRGIDDVMNVAGPILSKHGVAFLPRYSNYQETERVTTKGATLIHVRLQGDFMFVSARDGSWVNVVTFGVGMDSGDKACNKAMSAAVKYALLQTFLVPTESTDDADATTPEPSLPKPPDGFAEWFPAIVAEADQGFDALRSAWGDSPEAFRKYAMDYRTDEWSAAKAHATAITKAQKKVAAEKPEKPAKAAK